MSSTTPANPSSFRRFIKIDEDGYFNMDQLRVADAELGRRWLAELTMDNRGRAVIDMNGEPVLVEAFDEPYIVLNLEKDDASGPNHGEWRATMPYGYSEGIALDSLSLDEWDRYHGRTVRGIPFVLSRQAQARFFNLVDEFEDDAVTIDGRRIETKPWLTENNTVSEDGFWSDIYRSEEMRWDLGGPTHALDAVVPKLKLQPMRVLVPGAGRGHDAAWFARAGHIVTAVDFSDEAISRAQKLYGHLTNLRFIKSDVFALSSDLNGEFDLIFEHTCYCAITPSRRSELIRTYRRLLADEGHLLGVFFTMDKSFGPPYGGSEWEVRARLEKTFRLLYWYRLRDSLDKRLGHELLVYAQKLPSLS